MKIGILTCFYNNYNFGAVLQAYALTAYVNAQGFACEQIYYDRIPHRTLRQKLKNVDTPKKFLSHVYKRLRMRYQDLFVKGKFDQELQADWHQRMEIFKQFIDEYIPHSPIYTPETIERANEIYDAYISGSDVVWLPTAKDPNYFLHFAGEQLCLAYAASLGTGRLTEEETQFIKENIQRYAHISMREKSGKQLIEKLACVPVSVVSDPVLLLRKEEWAALAAPPITQKPYALAYLLGDSPRQRAAIVQFAREQGLTLINLANMATYTRAGKDFGDIQCRAAGPREFLSAICHAQHVFTDSFHGLVFATIFERPFTSCSRMEKNKSTQWNARLTDYLAQLRLPTALWVPGTHIGDTPIDYANIRSILEEQRAHSSRFLNEALFGIGGERNVCGRA